MPLKVAIFEDNMLLREMLFHLINDTQGFTCTGAFSDANNTIQKIQRNVPDVVLMDIEMPGMNGIEAVKKIKEHYPSIHVLMQTVMEDDENIFESIAAGASGYLLKNVAPAKLIEAIVEVDAGGSPMSPSIARKVLEKLSKIKQLPQPEKFDLTIREKEILNHLVNGTSYKIIADSCFISIDTVKFHMKNIYFKLRVNSKAEAVAKAFKSGLA